MRTKVKSSGGSEIANAIEGTRKVTQIPATHERCSVKITKKHIYFLSNDDKAYGYKLPLFSAGSVKLKVLKGPNM